MNPISKLQIPLRYPGSKARLLDYFEALIIKNNLDKCHIFEPYAGSAVVSFNMLHRGLASKATLIERDPLLYSFWRSVKRHPEELCQKISKVKVTLETWKKFQKYLAPDAKKKFEIVELGLACLFLNRTSFSGIIHAGPIGGHSQSSKYTVDCRFQNKAKIIQQILSLARFSNRFSIVNSKALSYLRSNRTRLGNQKTLVYLDPPYYVQGKRLYRFHYKTLDHKKFADFIKGQPYPWIISYDNHPDIRKMFTGAKIVPAFLNYVVKDSRNAEELLISRLSLPAPQYLDCKDNSIVPSPRKRMRLSG